MRFAVPLLVTSVIRTSQTFSVQGLQVFGISFYFSYYRLTKRTTDKATPADEWKIQLLAGIVTSIPVYNTRCEWH